MHLGISNKEALGEALYLIWKRDPNPCQSFEKVDIGRLEFVCLSLLSLCYCSSQMKDEPPHLSLITGVSLQILFFANFLTMKMSRRLEQVFSRSVCFYKLGCHFGKVFLHDQIWCSDLKLGNCSKQTGVRGFEPRRLMLEHLNAQRRL